MIANNVALLCSFESTDTIHECADQARFANMKHKEQLPRYLTDAHGRAVTPIISPPTPAKTPEPTSDAMATADATNSQLEDQSEIKPAPSARSSPPPALPRGRGRGRPPKDGIPKHLRPAGDIGAELRMLEQEQKLIGPLMGKMGCVLADKGRREGFLDDESFWDDVEDGTEFDDPEG
jgi:hypothetical protein